MQSIVLNLSDSKLFTDSYRACCVFMYKMWARSSVAHNYVGMARKKDGGSNQCINVYTAISSLGNKCSRLKVHQAAYRAGPSLQ